MVEREVKPYAPYAVPYTVPDKGPFDHLGLDPALVNAVDAIRYEAPTPIQQEANPAILAGRDVIGTARRDGIFAHYPLPQGTRIDYASDGLSTRRHPESCGKPRRAHARRPLLY